MRRIDGMLRRPTGVEYRELGEIGTLFGGLSGKTRVDFEGSGDSRYVSYLNVFQNLAANVRPHDSVSLRDGERQRRLQRGDVLFTGSSETRDECGMSSVVTIEPPEPLYLNSFCIGFRPRDAEMLEPDFAKHLFRSGGIRRQLVRTAQGVTRYNVSKAKLAKVRLPIPTIEVQREIAGVLDSFLSLEAELEAELEARRRQYAHYRRSLLTYERSTNAAPIGEVFKMRAGKHMPAVRIHDRSDSDHRYPCFGGNGIRGFVAEASHDGKHLLVGRQGALCGNVQRFEGAFFATEHAVVFTPQIELDLDWAFHLLEVMNLNQYATKSAQPGLAVGNIARVRMPLPHLAEQRRTAATLDSFDLLVNDLSVGLPAELAARRKQYAYYRDRLLSFEDAA